MNVILGPIPSDKIILCSADASPDSQRTSPDRAGYFFPGAPWVGAIRNSADRLGCRFVILTTGHGLVDPEDEIGPYDMHINEHQGEVTARWRLTIPTKLGKARNSLMVFYAGGCPRDSYIELAKPVLHQLGISLLTFGRPNMFDIDKIDDCARMLIQGTSLAQIASVLGHPERLEFHFSV